MRAARRVVLAVVGLGLALLVAAGAAGRWWSPKEPGALLASGTIEATEVRVSFKVSGRVVERPVDEGSRVQAGTLVGRLESLDLQAEVERLRAALRGTETLIPQLRTEIAMLEELTDSRIAESRAALASRDQQLAELRAGARAQELQIASAGVLEARASLDNAEADLKRIAALYDKELVSAQARDAAQTAYHVAREKHRAAVERLDLVREGARREQIARAEAEVQQARAALAGANAGRITVLQKRQELATLQANVTRDRAALAVAEAQLGYTVLRSPQVGVVLRKHVEPGEIIAAGTPVVTIADLTNVWLKIYVPEPQLGRVKLGQRAEIRTDSYPEKVYPGEVIFINSEAEFTPKNVQTYEERVKLVFAVKIAVDNTHQELKPGMPADAKLHLE